MERTVLEYVLNAVWQLPLLLLGGWLLVRVSRAEPAVEHGVWLAVLALAVILPLRGLTASSLTAGAPAGNAPEPERADASSVENGAPAIRRSDDPDRKAGVAVATCGMTEPVLWRTWLAGALKTREIRVSARLTHFVVRLYATAVLLAMGRLARAWMAAGRLVRRSVAVELCAEDSLVLERGSARLGVRTPEVRQSREVRTPGVLGVRRPVLLLPESFRACTREESRAALWHELAHLRRRDPAKQLAGEALSVPVAWHPAIWMVKARLRQTREMACDAIAATEMESAAGYARCLLTLARRIGASGTGRELAMVKLGDGVLEERVMRLVTGQGTTGTRARAMRMACGTAAFSATLATASVWHLRPMMAQAVATQTVAVQRAEGQTREGVAVPPGEDVDARAASAVAPPQTPAEPATPAAPAVPMAPARPEVPAKPKAPVAPASPIVTAPVIMTPELEPTPGVVYYKQGRPLTPAEQARVTAEIEASMQKAQQELREAQARLNSEEFHRQMLEAQAAAKEAQTKINSPEFQAEMERAQKQMQEATARMNSPEFRKQMDEEMRQQRLLQTESFRMQQAQMQAQMAAMRESFRTQQAQMKAQMAAMQEQIALSAKQMEVKRQDGIRSGRLHCKTDAKNATMCVTDSAP